MQPAHWLHARDRISARKRFIICYIFFFFLCQNVPARRRPFVLSKFYFFGMKTYSPILFSRISHPKVHFRVRRYPATCCCTNTIGRVAWFCIKNFHDFSCSSVRIVDHFSALVFHSSCALRPNSWSA